MKTFFSLVLICCTIVLSAQVSHIFSIDKDTYSITFSKNENNYDFTLFNVSDTKNKTSFTLPKLDIITFKNVMFENLKTLKSSMSLPQEDENVDRAINEVFYTAVANIDAIDDLNYAPIAGTITINKQVNIYRDVALPKVLGIIPKSNSDKIPGLLFKIEKVQIVFQNGFIQDVIVDGEIVADKKIDESKISVDIKEFVEAKLRFTNYYGIGFSSKMNIRKLGNTYLYTNQKENIDKKFTKPTKPQYSLFDLDEMSISLGEVLQFYDYQNGVYTTDYSPANQKISLKGGESSTLYKDKTYKILEARIFSDFLGFNSDKPNGLIQIEVDKQFNFNTTRYQFLWYKLRMGIGYLEYLKLNGGLTKIEDNKRLLIPDMEDEQATSYNGSNILINKRFSTPIDILNHQTWNIGTNANIFLIDMPTLKSQLHANVGFRFAQTKVQDSIRTINSDLSTTSKAKEYNFSYWQFYPEFVLHILPETRYGFYASWRQKYFYSLSENIEFAGARDILTGNRRENISKWINEFELLGYLYLNEEKQNGKLFIRWRLDSERGYSKNNFTQFQVGYAFYILGRGKQK
ncbi:hypothetical protein [Chryseobacterium cheonjiense]|uniref:Outer membrane protein beta-barrel domain-containing protein n=1 Tax=Chryseobacterium cheonjiense TaxID=2728845 RepID=A0A7Y0A4X0_9FLAO|nr:hypothetical protein [Chryseobacterium cheonjiense]NML56782.1 hypothetical protein [Chryseobacterium cheonjiense]